MHIPPPLPCFLIWLQNVTVAGLHNGKSLEDYLVRAALGVSHMGRGENMFGM